MVTGKDRYIETVIKGLVNKDKLGVKKTALLWIALNGTE